jgi:hypothetical protein
MKKIISSLLLLVTLISFGHVYAAPLGWDYSGGILSPVKPANNAPIKAGSFIATGTTTASTFAGAVIGKFYNTGGDTLSVKALNVTGDGISDETTAIQNAISYARRDGYVLYFPDGVYNISSPLEASSSITFSPQAVIKAIAPMTSMLNFGSSGQIGNKYITGGIFDGNNLADDGIFARQFAHLELSNILVKDVLKNSYHIGDSTLSASYEAIMSNLHSLRTSGTVATSSVGIFFDSNATDNTLSDSTFVGSETGVLIATSSAPNYIENVHVWSPGSIAGSMKIGFDLFAGSNYLKGCDADTASQYGMRIRTTSFVSVVGCRFYNNVNGSDGVVDAIFVDFPGANVSLVNNQFIGQSSTTRFRTDIIASSSNTFRAVGNSVSNTITSNLNNTIFNGGNLILGNNIGSAVIIPNASVNGNARTLRFSNGASAGNEGFQFYNSLTATNLLFIQNDGNVGIGTTTPDSALTVSGNLHLLDALTDSASSTGSLGMVLQTTGTSTRWVATSTLGLAASLSGGSSGLLTRWTGDTILGTSLFRDNGTVTGVNATSSTSTFLVQGTAGINPFTIASSTGTSLVTVLQNGAVGIGTTAPVSTLNVEGNNASGILTLSNSNTAVVASTVIGQTDFYTRDVSTITNRVVASIRAIAEGEYFTTDVAPTSLAFFTRPNTGVVTEKMRITSSGNVGISTTTPASKLTIVGTAGTAPVFTIASSTGVSMFDVLASGRVGVGSSTPAFQLTTTGTVGFSGLTASAGTPSSVCQNATTKEITVNAALTCTVSARDQKANIKDLRLNALDMVMQLKPSTFFYKDNLERERLGFIADEVQAIDSRLGDAYKDGEARSIDLPALTALNTKAIQELYRMGGLAQKSAEDNWQWVTIVLLFITILGQQYQIAKIKNSYLPRD